MGSHQLDTAIDISKEIDSLAVREQLRTALPHVVDRLSEALLSTVHQSATSALNHSALDMASSESYLIMDANHAVKKVGIAMLTR